MKRNPYADTGLVVSIAVLLCLLIKSALFGFTVASIIWIVLCIAYFVVSWKYASESKQVKVATHVFFGLSVAAVFSVMLFDTNARPKMHAFAGALNDTIDDEPEFIVDEQPSIYVDTTRVDTAEVDTFVIDTDVEIEGDANADVDAVEDMLETIGDGEE